MGLLIWIALCGVGLWLAPRVRPGEPWILRWGWLLSLSMIAFGITSGTRASWQQWIVGTVQAWLAAGICCELRIRQTRLPPPGGTRQRR
jgi:uncharacterized membrane protein